MIDQNIIKRLRFEDFIWAIFALIALASIFGDELIIKSIREKNPNYAELANHLFLVVIITTIIIYTYFLNRNYKDWKNTTTDKEAYEVRLLGSIFIFVGTLGFLYFLIKIAYSDESVSGI